MLSISRRKAKRRLRLAVAATLLGAILVGAIGLFLLERKYTAQIERRLSGHRWDISSKLYGEPYFVRPGAPFTVERLVGILDDLHYRKAAGVPSIEGEYSTGKSSLDIYPRAFPALGIEKLDGPVRIVLHRGRVLDVKSIRDGSRLYSLAIEPQLITEYFSSAMEGRDVVKISRIPKTLIQAILAAEDQRFFEHTGFDLLAMMRALLVDVFTRRTQGGSTVTQQVVKNYFLTPERSLRRKIQEIFMAWCLERRATKQEIMELYVNEVYLGQRGTISINGFAMASRMYFRKSVSDLSLDECALLAGIIRAPNNYSPYTYASKALERRNWVLDRMVEEEFVTRDAVTAAKARKVHVESLSKEVNQAPYFADWTRRSVSGIFSDQELRTKNYAIFTTIDPSVQDVAQQVLRESLDRLQKTYAKRFGKRRLEGCLIAVDPRTGAIRAMAGGKSYTESQFNRATDAHRQIGSVMKPVVFAAAFTDKREKTITPATMIVDEETTFLYKGNEWTPANFEGYKGPVNLRRVLAESLNVATAKLALQTGLNNVISTARRLGISAKIPAYPSISLGAFEVAPIEVAEAFATIANGGVRVGLQGIKEIRDDQGRTLYKPEVKRERVLPADANYLLIDLMKSVVNDGTAASIRSRGFSRPAAGKTGTTNDMRDCWFVGFVPQFLTVVWVGFDDNSPVGLTGAQAAVPIWSDFMSKTLAGTPEEEFFIPEDIVFRAVDPANGKLATSLCYPIDILPFIAGTEPIEFCQEHGL